jgi:hypothetical protein
MTPAVPRRFWNERDPRYPYDVIAPPSTVRWGGGAYFAPEKRGRFGAHAGPSRSAPCTVRAGQGLAGRFRRSRMRALAMDEQLSHNHHDGQP